MNHNTLGGLLYSACIAFAVSAAVFAPLAGQHALLLLIPAGLLLLLGTFAFALGARVEPDFDPRTFSYAPLTPVRLPVVLTPPRRTDRVFMRTGDEDRQ